MSGSTMTVALNSGYHAAFLVGTLFVVVAVVIVALFLRPKSGAGASPAMH